MPRQTRRKSGTGIYHVMLHGINRQDIFEEEEDYLHFLRSMNCVVESKDDCGEALPPLCHFYAYCLMPNHVIQRVKKQTGEPSPGLDTREGVYLGTNKAETDFIYITDKGQYRQLEDGRYAINISSRVALNDTELDAEAYSKIFTNSFRLGGSSTSELVNGKIQVTVWQREGGSKVAYSHTENASFDGKAIANTDSDHTKGALITVFVWPQGTEERELFSTRSNVNSTIIDHEYKGHYIKNYHHKKGVSDPIYKMQRESDNWKKTTLQYKEYQNDVIKENGWE